MTRAPAEPYERSFEATVDSVDAGGTENGAGDVTVSVGGETTTADAANAALMVEFVWVALAGLAAGVLFDAYFKRRGRRLGRHLQRVVRR